MRQRVSRISRGTQTSGRTRATQAIVASASLLAIIAIGLPWVDEYLRLRREAADFSELQDRLVEARARQHQMDRIEGKITGELEQLVSRSTDPDSRERVRETLIEFVRQAGGRIRRLEITDGETRPWAVKGDDARNDTMTFYEEESRFALHTHTVELHADGSLESIRRILGRVMQQGWLMSTRNLFITPTGIPQSPISMEMQMVLYGLGPRESTPDEEFALQQEPTALR